MRRKILFLSILLVFISSFALEGRILDRFLGKEIRWIIEKGSTKKAPLQSDYITSGKNALSRGDILAARDYFKSAVSQNPYDEEANFLYGLTRILAVYEEGKEAKTPNLTSVKGLALSFGITFYSFGLFGTEALMPDQLPSSSPTVDDVKNFIKTKLLPEVDGAIGNLEKVSSQNFASTINTGEGTITIDLADALIIKSAVYALKATIEMILAYNLQFRPPDILNGDMHEILRIRKVFEQNPNFLKPSEPQRLQSAKTAIISFVESYKQGANLLRQRKGYTGHLFVVDVALEDSGFNMTSDETQKFENVLSDLKNALSGPYECTNAFPDYSTPERTFDLSKFFNQNSPINLKDLLFDSNGDFYLHDLTLAGLAPYGIRGITQEILLLPGWNLISLPVIPKDLSISSVLKPIEGRYLIVWGYDPETGWKSYRPGRSQNSLTSFEEGKGYWIYMTQPGHLHVTGKTRSRSVQLKGGWNLVAYPGAYDGQSVEEAFQTLNGFRYTWTYGNGRWYFYSPQFELQGIEKMRHLTRYHAYWINVGGDTAFSPPPLLQLQPGQPVCEIWIGSKKLPEGVWWYNDPQQAGLTFFMELKGPGSQEIQLPEGTKVAFFRAKNAFTRMWAHVNAQVRSGPNTWNWSWGDELEVDRGILIAPWDGYVEKVYGWLGD